MNFGILLRKPIDFNLLAYTDADWGGNADDRTSTSAYLIFLWWQSNLLAFKGHTPQHRLNIMLFAMATT